ncbi:MAG: ATP-grasp domain-containing protein [Bacteroidetes bacterium]|nr:ATP-grasp domain-containing protein [Bacteroidota bacterium]
MKNNTHILFPQSPIHPNKVDEDFEEQYLAAKENGFETLLFSFEDLSNPERVSQATNSIKRNDEPVWVIYRGWMLTPTQYALLYADLLEKNLRLINNAGQYQNCHYLPDSLRFIESHTPKTVFEPLDKSDSIDTLIDKAKVFGNKPVIIKDYVKSEKHDWETACFVPDASDTNFLKQSIQNLVALRGNYLNEGIVIRDFVPLNALTTHSKSGMPLTEEYRLFFCNQQLVGIYDYWEEGEYTLAKPDTTEFEAIARQVESHFFSMDIARQTNDQWIIIELGDGQVAGLPDKTSRTEFYERLKACCD